MGFRGRAAGEVDALEASNDSGTCISIQLTTCQPLWSNTQELGKSAVSVGEERGGYGGGTFDMLDTIGDPLKEVLTEIKVNSGPRVHGIEVRGLINEEGFKH